MALLFVAMNRDCNTSSSQSSYLHYSIFFPLYLLLSFFNDASTGFSYFQYTHKPSFHSCFVRERDRDRDKFRLFVWVLERNPDGFQFVLDVLRDVLCDIPGFDAVVHMVVEEAREHRDILPESDLKGFGSIQRRVQYPEPVCLDPGGYVLYGKGNHRNLGIWHCCLLCVLEDWFVSASLSLCHFLYVILVKSL